MAKEKYLILPKTKLNSGHKAANKIHLSSPVDENRKKWIPSFIEQRPVRPVVPNLRMMKNIIRQFYSGTNTSEV